MIERRIIEMEKKQQIYLVFGWIKEKINAARANLKITEKSGLSRRTQKQKDAHLDGSLCILRNREHILRSLQ